MSLKSTAAAFVVAATLPMTPANALAREPADPCARIFNVNVVASQLFNTPPAKWPMAQVSMLGPNVHNQLRDMARTRLPREIASGSEMAFHSIENARKSGREPNWEYVARRANPILHPIFEDVQNNKLTVDAARTKTLEVSHKHVMGIVAQLDKVKQGPQFCLAAR